jgi:hypothetical protein
MVITFYFTFPSPSLEEEGEKLICHSEQREETPLRDTGMGKKLILLSIEFQNC